MIKNVKFWISLALILAFGGYVFAPTFLSQDFVQRLDVTALGILILAALPWLINLVSEIEAFGVKAKMREVEKKADTATKDAQEARSAAADARVAAEKSNKEAQTAETIAQKATKRWIFCRLTHAINLVPPASQYLPRH